MNFYAAFDLGGSYLKYGFGQKNQIFYDGKLRVTSQSIEGLYDLFDEALRDMETHLPRDAKLVAATIGSPGTVLRRTGRITGTNPNLPYWTEIRPAHYLSNRWKLPVYIDNDANLMVYGEAAAFSPRDTILGITIGTGIGSGLIMRNTIYRGATDSIELGHSIVVAHGNRCACGKQGCVEAYASANSLVRDAVKAARLPKDTTIYDVLVTYRTRPEVVRTITRAMDLLAQALANGISIMNPNVVIIGGGVVDIEAFPFTYLQDQLSTMLLPNHRIGLRIEKARLGNKAALLGGIRLAEHKDKGVDRSFA